MQLIGGHIYEVGGPYLNEQQIRCGDCGAVSTAQADYYHVACDHVDLLAAVHEAQQEVLRLMNLRDAARAAWDREHPIT